MSNLSHFKLKLQLHYAGFAWSNWSSSVPAVYVPACQFQTNCQNPNLTTTQPQPKGRVPKKLRDVQ